MIRTWDLWSIYMGWFSPYEVGIGLTLEGMFSEKTLDSLTYKVCTIFSCYHNPYLWQSHQVWGFFTFLVDLAYCAARAPPPPRFRQPWYMFSLCFLLSWSFWPCCRVCREATTPTAAAADAYVMRQSGWKAIKGPSMRLLSDLLMHP